MKVLGIGNAIIDVLCKVSDDFLIQNSLTKSTMKLIDETEFKRLLSLIKIEETVSGGSVANSIVGLSQLGNKVGFLAKNPTLFPNCDKPTIELATDPPETVSSIFINDRSLLNSVSSINFIVLFVNEF